MTVFEVELEKVGVLGTSGSFILLLVFVSTHAGGDVQAHIEEGEWRRLCNMV